MRPYLAIIKDSFRAAMASRVLYVLLILITLLLVALAPLHIDESLDWRLVSDVNVHKPDALMRRVLRDKETNPQAIRVWSMLSGPLKKQMADIVEQSQKKPVKPNQGPAESFKTCLLYTSPSPRDQRGSRMPSSA